MKIGKSVTLSLSCALAALIGLSAGGEAAAGLVASYAFDETSGSVAHDSVGGVDGNLTSTGAAFVAGAGVNGSGAVSLSRSSGGLVNMGNHFGFASYSIQVWVNLPAGTSAVEVPVGKHVAGAGVGYFIAIGNAGDGCCGPGVPQLYPGNYPLVGGTSAVGQAAWHQLVATFDAGTGVAALYLDGSLQNSIAGASTQFNATDFLVGGTTVGPTYDGLIDDLRIWDNALTAQEVSANFSGPEQPSQVPEPATLALMGGALAALAAGSRRKSARA